MQNTKFTELCSKTSASDSIHLLMSWFSGWGYVSISKRNFARAVSASVCECCRFSAHREIAQYTDQHTSAYCAVTELTTADHTKSLNFRCASSPGDSEATCPKTFWQIRSGFAKQLRTFLAKRIVHLALRARKILLAIPSALMLYSSN